MLERDKIITVVDYYLAMPKPSYKRALIEAGDYSEAYANNAHEWFKKPEVAAVLAERRQDIASRNGVNIDDLVARLKFIAFGDFSKFIHVMPDGTLDYNFTDATPEELSLINELTVETTRYGKRFRFGKVDPLKAIELLGRILGAFKDKTEHSLEKDLISQLRAGRMAARKTG